MRFLRFVFLFLTLFCAFCFAQSINTERLKTHVRYLSSDQLQGRYPGTKGDSLTQIYISNYYSEIGLESIYPDSNYSQPFFVGYEDGCDVFSSNIIGYIPGKNKVNSIIIGAHFDHIGIHYKHSSQDTVYNGADDNASGVAIVLEIARRCAEYGPFDCNLYFTAFGAEEKHSIGAYHFINQWPDSLGEIKAMLNFDMVGRMENSTLFINLSRSAREWRDYLSKILVDDLDVEYDISRAWTDSRVFLKEDIPSLWFFTGFHDDYHRPGDEYQKLNYQGMEKMLNLASNFIEYISRDSVKLIFNECK